MRFEQQLLRTLLIASGDLRTLLIAFLARNRPIREESIRQEDDTRIFTQCVHRKQKIFNISLIRKGYCGGGYGDFTTLEEMKKIWHW